MQVYIYIVYILEGKKQNYFFAGGIIIHRQLTIKLLQAIREFNKVTMQQK